MMSIICENCETTVTTGAGRFVVDKGNVNFYCADCEQKVFLSAIKNPKPRTVKRVPRETNGKGEEALVSKN